MAWLLRREELAGEQARRALCEEPRRAAREILVQAEAGSRSAQLLLGQILLEGHGIAADAALARVWFGIAAAAGEAMAHNMLGRCHEHGRGGPVDLPQAARCYRNAAEAGLDWGCYNLANLLATGRGVDCQPAAALALYRQAARLGHAKSMNLLGRYLEIGEVVPRDLPAAHDWYRRAAEGGDFRGQFSHACVLAEQGQHAAADDWLQRALQEGNLNFLRVAREHLAAAGDERLRRWAPAYGERAAQLGDSSDQARLLALQPVHEVCA